MIQTMMISLILQPRILPAVAVKKLSTTYQTSDEDTMTIVFSLQTGILRIAQHHPHRHPRRLQDDLSTATATAAAVRATVLRTRQWHAQEEVGVGVRISM